MVKTNLKNAITMNSSEVEPCVQKLDYTVPVSAIEQELNDVVKQFSVSAEIPGFRKGKAPAGMIKKRYMPQIEEELMKRFYSTAFEKASSEEKLEIISYAAGDGEEQRQLKLNEDFTFSINFNTAPALELPKYKGIKLDAPASEVSDKAVDEKIDYYKNLYAEYKTIEIPAEKEDLLKVSYSSDFKLEGDVSDSLKQQLASEESWIWLNEPEVIPGAIKSLVGAVKDGEYSFESVYPDDYREAALAGQKVNYTVNVFEVQRRMPLESDEQLCKKMQLENMEKLREQLTESIKSEADAKRNAQLKEVAYEKLASGVGEFPIPPAMLNSETQKELKNIASKLVKSEEDAEKFKKEQDKHMKEAEKAAKNRMRRFFILKKIATEESIGVDQAELDQHLQSLSAYYGYKEKELRKIMESSGGMEDLHMDILMSKAVDFIVEQAEVLEIKGESKQKK